MSTATVHADQAQALRRLMGALSTTKESSCVRARVAPDPADRARLIAITSGKGGVGKTFVAVNLSVALSQLGALVTLVDADLGTANADLVCGVNPGRRLEAGLRGRRLDEIAVLAPGGFRLIAGSAGVATMADLDERERARLVEMVREVRRTSDFVLVDTGAGIGASVLDVVGACDAGVVVVTPEPTSIADAYALIKSVVRRSGEVPRLMALVNQASSRDEALEVHDRIARVSAKFLGGYAVEWLGWIPRDERASRAVRARRAMVLEYPWSRPSRRVRETARELRRLVRPESSVRSPDGASGLGREKKLKWSSVP